MLGGGFITNDTVKGINVLEEYSVVTLSSKEEDDKDFTSVVFSERGDELFAAGGGVGPHGLYTCRLEDIRRAAAEEQSHEVLRGAMKEFKQPLGKRCGIRHLAVPRRPNSRRILFSSDNGWDHSVRLGVLQHGLVEIDVTFSAHRDLVTSLVTPHANTESGANNFISTSRDGTACLWSLECIGRPVHTWKCNCSPAAAFDSTGLVMAVTRSSDAVDLYDRRMLTNGQRSTPFGTFRTGIPLGEEVLSLAFMPYSHQSAKVEQLLITGSKTVSLLDTSSSRGACNVYHTGAASGTTCLLPDGAVALRGSADGVHFINTSNGSDIKVASTGIPTNKGRETQGLAGPLASATVSHGYWAAALASGSRLQCMVWPYNPVEASAYSYK